MSAQKIEKIDVAGAIEALINGGKKPTIQAIRAALGDRGSTTTILNLKRELEDEKLSAQDSPKALEAFRGIWKSAVGEGLTQRDEEFKDLQETVAALSCEVEKYEGQALALQSQASVATKKHEELLAKERVLKDELSTARETAERNARKLIEVLEKHQLELVTIQVQLEEAKLLSHKFELELAGANAKLDILTHEPKSSNAAADASIGTPDFLT